MKKRSLSDRVYLVLKGVAMGTVNKIPGVSGGIVALIGGFYEELIYTFQKFDGKALVFLLKGQWKSFYSYTNFQFLNWLLLGVVISYFTTALLLDQLLAYSEINVWACFFGMILVSLYYIYEQITHWDRVSLAILFLGFFLGVLISFSNAIPENTNLLFVFFCGIVSVCGMTLPGLSGSYLLILLGNYSLLLVDTVNRVGILCLELLKGNFMVLEDPFYQQAVFIIIAFVLGSISGLILFSNILSYLLKNFKHHTLSGIWGFIIGATKSVWPWKTPIYKTDSLNAFILSNSGKPKIEAYKTFWPNWGDFNSWVTLFFILLGGAIVIALEWYGKKQKQQ